MDIFLTAGIVLGLSAGLSPGPLTTLVIAQAMQYGVREGLKVALAPLITDTPIVLLSVLVMTRLSNFHAVLGTISILGAFFLVYLAYSNFKATKVNMTPDGTAPGSLGKGILANFLSPYLYLFWMSVGAPYAVDAWTQSSYSMVGFFTGFYACLVGSKMLLAVLAAKARRFLAGRAYGFVMRILGGLMLLFAFLLFRDAIALLKLANP
ncbi:LysE family translocator [Thermodesulfobacteriota bacterium]